MTSLKRVGRLRDNMTGLSSEDVGVERKTGTWKAPISPSSMGICAVLGVGARNERKWSKATVRLFVGSKRTQQQDYKREKS